MMLRKLFLPTVLLSSLVLLAACSMPETAPDTGSSSNAAGTAEPEAAGESAQGTEQAASDTEDEDAAEDADEGEGDDASGSAAKAPGGNPEQPFEEGGNLEVPTAMVAEALDGGTKLLFLDARDKLNYESGHIPGAVNVPFFEVEKHLDKVPNDDTWLIAYCACPTAEAEQLAQKLLDNGYTKVKILQEGLNGWTDLGRDLEKGPSSS